MKLTGLKLLSCLFTTLLFAVVALGYPASNSEAVSDSTREFYTEPCNNLNHWHSHSCKSYEWGMTKDFPLSLNVHKTRVIHIIHLFLHCKHMACVTLKVLSWTLVIERSSLNQLYLSERWFIKSNWVIGGAWSYKQEEVLVKISMISFAALRSVRFWCMAVIMASYLIDFLFSFYTFINFLCIFDNYLSWIILIIV